MPLPSTQGYHLGTRVPMSFVTPALEAYLAVSRDMRERHAQMMQDLDQSQTMFLRGREEGRRSQSHAMQVADSALGTFLDFDNQAMKHEAHDLALEQGQEALTDTRLNRGFRIEDQAMQRERHDVFLQNAGLDHEAALFERDVIRPMRVEADRLRLREAGFNLKLAREAELAKAAKLGKFDADLGTFRQIYEGQVPSPDPAVVDGSIDQGLDLIGGLSGYTGALAKGEHLQPNQLYWNHDLGRPFISVGTDDSGSVQMLGPGGIGDLKTGSAQQWSRLRSMPDDQIPAPDRLAEFFANVPNPGEPGVLGRMTRARDAAEYLNYMDAAYADLPNAKPGIATARRLLEADEGFQMARSTGWLTSPLEREQRTRARQTQLRLMFGSDDAFREWQAGNPSLFDAVVNLPADEFEPAIRRLESQIETATKSRQPSATIRNSLTDAEIKLRQAEAALAGARERTSVSPTTIAKLEAEVESARIAVDAYRARIGGGASSTPATPRVPDAFY